MSLSFQFQVFVYFIICGALPCQEIDYLLYKNLWIFFHPFFLVELAMIMDRLYGGVCYAGIDTDPELKYPKGAGRVAFSNQQSYIAAISARFVQLQHGEIDKRVSIFKVFMIFDCELLLERS